MTFYDSFQIPLAFHLLGIYFLCIFLIAWVRSRNANGSSYFQGNKSSNWFLVSFGMLSDSLSGVTFVSVPGEVGSNNFAYFQLIIGNFIGYILIAKILLPLFYSLEVTSIYSYLGKRFGRSAQKTAASFFIGSRAIGSAFRIFLAASILQIALFDVNEPSVLFSVFIILFLITAYSIRGGMRSLVWTDSFQTLFLLLSLGTISYYLIDSLNLTLNETVELIRRSPLSTVFVNDPNSKLYFGKQILSGVFIALGMTGLDQNMMQKSLTCPNLEASQKNFILFGFTTLIVNLIFLSLGALMFIFYQKMGLPIPVKSDMVLPVLALKYLGQIAPLFFILGMAAATFSSADSVLTTLTTSFCYDFLQINNRPLSERAITFIRNASHIGFALLIFLIVFAFEQLERPSVVSAIFTAAGYTYGPLIGLFFFGLFSTRSLASLGIPIICLLAPGLSFCLSQNSQQFFNGYQIGFELIAINSFLTYIGLFLISKRQ